MDAVKNAFSVVSDTIGGIVKNAWNWGSNMVNALANGIRSGINAVGNAVGAVAGKIKGFLGFHSPTKEGPGSESDKWMPNMIQMFEKGIKQGLPDIREAALSAAQTLSLIVPIDMDALKGRKCYGGLDLASTDDIAAFVLVFPPDDTTEHYIVLPFFWIPSDNISKRVKKHHVPYDRWVKDGFLSVTEGNIIHYEFIEQKILDLRSVYEIKEVAFDDWGAAQMIQRLQDMTGIEYISFRQGFKSFSSPSKEMMRLVLDSKIQHGGHPVLRWMFNNVFIETDAAANIKPSKDKSSEKIDGAVATIMALDRAIRQKEHKSVYNTRGILSYGEDGFNW